MSTPISRKQTIVLAVVLITIAAGFISLSQKEEVSPESREIAHENATGNDIIVPKTRSYATTPEETFREYSNLIDQGSYEDAISLVVMDSGNIYQKPSTHTQAIIKGEMTSTYGGDGENFDILNLDITAQEPLDEELLRQKKADDGYVLSYTMRYNLGGSFGVLSEKATIVGIDGGWKVVYPEPK